MLQILMIVGLVVAVLSIGFLSFLSNPTSEDASGPVPAKVSYSSHDPIYINGNAQFNYTLYPANGVVSGNGTVSNPYLIAGWDIDASTDHGIVIWGASVHFVIRNCHIHDGWNGGIGNIGIYIANCANGVVIDNIAVNNSVGIDIQSSSNFIVNNNTCSYNENVGIYLMLSSNGNTISNNTCGFNNHYGMSIQESDDNTLSDNNCSNNLALGIYITYWSSGNTLYNNNCSSNYPYGIVIQESSSNTLRGNNCSDNLIGIYISQSSDHNNISWNSVFNNDNQGIDLQSGSHNRVWSNTFAGNSGGGVQAHDSGTDNWWNSTDGYGNYWSDWTAPDNDSDGVVDIPYSIDGTAGAADHYPMTTAPTVIPEFSSPVIVLGVALAMGTVFISSRSRRKDRP